MASRVGAELLLVLSTLNLLSVPNPYRFILQMEKLKMLNGLRVIFPTFPDLIFACDYQDNGDDPVKFLHSDWSIHTVSR